MNPKFIFEAQSVAIIGASTNPEKLGYKILENVVKAGFKGDIYPINPKAPDVLGIKAYPSILDVPKTVDLAVFIIPSKFVPSTMEQCVKKGVKGAVVITGGFGEVGRDDLEAGLLETAKKGNIPIVGPNCQGINNTHIGLNASWPVITKQGPISVISQSGTVFAALEMWAEEDDIGVSKAVALGNKKGIDEADLVEYFGADKSTKVIAIYTEGVNDGRRFMNALQRITPKKPVVILKPGRTEAGARAVLSHTKSLAGDDKVYDAAFKQSGAIRANTLEELYDSCKALAHLPQPLGSNLLIVTSSGGAGILAVDLAEEYGFNMPEIPEKLSLKLRENLPDYCILKNPLDLTGSAYSELYETVLNHLLPNPTYDALLLIYGDPIPKSAELAAPIIKTSKKPVMISYLGGGSIQPQEIKAFHEIGIPVFPTSERAIQALKSLTDYTKLQKGLKH